MYYLVVHAAHSLPRSVNMTRRGKWHRWRQRNDTRLSTVRRSSQARSPWPPQIPQKTENMRSRPSDAEDSTSSMYVLIAPGPSSFGTHTRDLLVPCNKMGTIHNNGTGDVAVRAVPACGMRLLLRWQMAVDGEVEAAASLFRVVAAATDGESGGWGI